MAYTIKNQKKGRPRVLFKVRNLEGITPKGFELDRVEGKVAIYKRKKKNEK
jgi:hypothetical protein